MGIKSMRLALALTGAILAIASASAAWTFTQRARQVRTFTDLQSMTWLIEKQGDRYTLQEAVASVAGGRDGWGNHVTVLQSVEKGYLLISPGSDGKIDVEDASIYYESSISDIRGDYSSDIVFRNGKPLTLAGK